MNPVADRFAKFLSTRFWACLVVAVPAAFQGEWGIALAAAIVYIAADSITKVIEGAKLADKFLEVLSSRFPWAAKADQVLDAVVAELEKVAKGGAPAPMTATVSGGVVAATPVLDTLGK